MKTLDIIKKIIIGILLIVFFGFAITMTVLILNFNDYGITQIGDTSFIFINSKISSDTYKKGDLVLVEAEKIENIKVGDEAFVYHLDTSGVISIDVGDIGKVYPENDAISFVNGNTYSMKYVVGKASKVYNNLGTYLSIIESRWGFLFIVLIPIFLMFIYQIYTLIVEIKYGKAEALLNEK